MAGERWQVHVVRTGGFAGLRRSATVAAEDLEPPEREQLGRLLDSVDAAALSRSPSGPGVPDGFQYDVTVERAGRSEHFTVHDGSMPEEVRPLIEGLAPHLRPG